MWVLKESVFTWSVEYACPILISVIEIWGFASGSHERYLDCCSRCLFGRTCKSGLSAGDKNLWDKIALDHSLLSDLLPPLSRGTYESGDICLAICFYEAFQTWFLICEWKRYLPRCHAIIAKNIGKEEKKKWRGDLTETIGAYERLGLLELRLELFHINWRKDGEKSKMERFMNCFHTYSII